MGQASGDGMSMRHAACRRRQMAADDSSGRHDARASGEPAASGLRPERHITGFSIRKEDGTEIPLIFEAAVGRARDTVVLKLTGPVPEKSFLWYGYGLNPVLQPDRLRRHGRARLRPDRPGRDPGIQGTRDGRVHPVPPRWRPGRCRAARRSGLKLEARSAGPGARQARSRC